MKRYLYYPVVAIICIMAIPALLVILIKKKKWNKWGEKIDKYFGVDSRYTKQKNMVEH